MTTLFHPVAAMVTPAYDAVPAEAYDRDPSLYTAEDFLPFTRKPVSTSAMQTPAYGASSETSESSRSPRASAEGFLPFVRCAAAAVSALLTHAYGLPGPTSEVTRVPGFYHAAAYLPFTASPSAERGRARRAA